MTREQIAKRIVEKTKSDEFIWVKTGVKDGSGVYLAKRGHTRIVFDGELTLTEPSGATRFVIDFELLDCVGLVLLLDEAIISSIDRQVPEWVVECLA